MAYLHFFVYDIDCLRQMLSVKICLCHRLREEEFVFYQKLHLR